MIEELARSGDTYLLHMPNQLFHNENGKRFAEVGKFQASVPDPESRNGKRASELAAQVFAMSETYEHARTMAMALAETGNCEEAVKWQEKALFLANSQSLTESGMRLLKEEKEYYQNNSPCRVPAQSD